MTYACCMGSDGGVYLCSWDGHAVDVAIEDYGVWHMRWSILFANHKANGVVTNIGLLGNTVDDTGSYMAG